MIFKVVGMGQVLWDVLPSGAELGGAPMNLKITYIQIGRAHV